MRRAVIVSVLAAAAMAVSPAVLAQQQRCCFNNWRYSGTCIVEIQEGQTCGDVLAALNNPLDVSTYCGGGGAGFSSTNIRSGWLQVPCDGQPAGPSKGLPTFITPVTQTTMPTTTPQTTTPEKVGQPPGVGTTDAFGSISPTQPDALKPQEPSVVTLNGAFHGF